MDSGLPLKTFKAHWTRKGAQLLLACAKCQRKLRSEDDPAGLAKLKKTLKKQARLQGLATRLIVLPVKCLKVCPKHGVAVCTQAQLGAGQGSILRSTQDIALLLRACEDGA